MELKVSFTESFDPDAPRQFSSIFSNLILNAHLPEEASDSSEGGIGGYAGNLAILDAYTLEGDTCNQQPKMTALRVEKQMYFTADGTAYPKYIARDSRSYTLWKSSLPRTPIPGGHGDAEVVAEDVRVVHWNIFVPQPRVVIVYREVPAKEQILKMLARIGGSLTVVVLVYTALFPRKYASSTFAAMVDMRTLRGSENRSVQPQCPDLARERYGEWRFWLPPPASAGENSGLELPERRPE